MSPQLPTPSSPQMSWRERLRIYGLGKLELIIISVVGVLAVVVIILGILFREIRPSQQFPQIVSQEPNSGQVEVFYDGDRTQPRAQADTVEITSMVPRADLLSFVGTQLGLAPSTFSETTYISSDSQEVLTNAVGDQGVEYHDFTNAPQSGQIATLEPTQQKAKEFLQRLGIPESQLQLQPEKTLYLDPTSSSEEEDLPVPPERATLITYSYERVYDGIPVTSESSSIEALSISVTSSGVRSAKIPPIYFTTGAGTSRRLVSVDQALNQIGNGDYAIASNLINRVFPGTSLKSLTLNTMSLQYRIIEAEDRMVPMYRFSGTVMLSNGQENDIVVITPAYTTQANPQPVQQTIEE